MQTVEEEYVKLNKAFRKKETNISYYQRRKNNTIEYPAKILEEYKKYYENKRARDS